MKLYDATQVLSINLSFAASNRESTPDSHITPQTPLKNSETSTKKILKMRKQILQKNI